jgi:hypothetical protein
MLQSNDLKKSVALELVLIYAILPFSSDM